MNLLPSSSKATHIKIYLLAAIILLIFISIFSSLFIYRADLKEQLDFLKISEQERSIKEQLSEEIITHTNNWSLVLKDIPIDIEKINVSTITKRGNGLIVTGESLNFLAVAEFAILIDSSQLVTSVTIADIEKVNEPQEKINFKISIILT